jgi:hypothetical protein
MRVVRIGTLAVFMAVLAALPSVAAAKKPDRLACEPPAGSVECTAGEAAFTLDAQAHKKSTAATGSLVVHLSFGDIVGGVTCLDVQGGLAVASGPLLPGTTAVDITFTQGYNLYVREGSPDLLQLELLSFVPEGCFPQEPISPAQVTTGDVVLTDGARIK